MNGLMDTEFDYPYLSVRKDSVEVDDRPQNVTRIDMLIHYEPLMHRDDVRSRIFQALNVDSRAQEISVEFRF